MSMLGLPIIIRPNFLCKFIAGSFALGALTHGSAQPGTSTFDGAISKDFTARINPSARVELLPGVVFIPWVLNRIPALFPATTSASLRSALDRDLTPSISAAPADSGLLSLPEATNGPIVNPPKTFPGEISGVSPSVATSLPTTGFAFLATVSDRDPTRSISATPFVASGSPRLPVSTDELLMNPHLEFLTAIVRKLVPAVALLPTTTSASLKSASDRELTLSISNASADSGSHGPPIPTNKPLRVAPRKEFLRFIPVVLHSVAALLPTTTSASLKSASDRDLTLSILATPTDFGSTILLVNSNERHLETSKQTRSTATSRQTSSTSGHDSATGHIETSPVHSDHRSSRGPSKTLGHSLLPPLNEPGKETSDFPPANRGQQKQDSPKGPGETPAQVSPVGPNSQQVQPVQVTSEGQKHQQQTSQREQEHQRSTVSNLGRASHLALSTNHMVSHFPKTPTPVTIAGTIISSLTSKALVIAKATIRPSKFTSSQPSSFFSASNITTAAAGSAPFDSSSTLNTARNAEVSALLSSTPGSLRYTRAMHTSTKSDDDLPTTKTSTSTSTSISLSNTMAPLRGFQSKTHVPRMIFGGCIIFALAYISF